MNGEFFTTTFPWLLPLAQFYLAVFLVLLFAVTINALEGREWNKQKMALAAWQFDDAYFKVVLQQNPHLTEADIIEAFELLRQYFYVCWKDDTKSLAVPSQLVDKCWLVFMQDSRKYMQFCDAVFGYYLQRR